MTESRVVGECLKEQRRWKATKEDGEYVIRGKRGTIACYGDGDINVWVRNLRVANKIPWKPLHTFDDGADYCRKIADLDAACRYIKARKRRQVTEAMRQRGRELAAALRSSKENPLQASGSAGE
jgi:hypothetical protein